MGTVIWCSDPRVWSWTGWPATLDGDVEPVYDSLAGSSCRPPDISTAAVVPMPRRVGAGIVNASAGCFSLRCLWTAMPAGNVSFLSRVPEKKLSAAGGGFRRTQEDQRHDEQHPEHAGQRGGGVGAVGRGPARVHGLPHRAVKGLAEGVRDDGGPGGDGVDVVGAAPQPASGGGVVESGISSRDVGEEGEANKPPQGREALEEPFFPPVLVGGVGGLGTVQACKRTNEPNRCSPRARRRALPRGI
jgi:hypothetical protein